MEKKGQLYLIPSLLGDEAPKGSLAAMTVDIINQLDYYLAENAKHTRRFLKAMGIQKPIQELHIEELNEHTDPDAISKLLEPARQGFSMGIISEAGCPGIADPGAEAVRIAQKENIRVVPVPGPSSIFLAIMGSGFNGQQFAFSGYLPKEASQRAKKIKELERLAQSGSTQAFMDTPYRNEHVLNDLLQHCNDQTLLCIACDITLPGEYIRTKSISTWKKQKPNLHKRPCIFVLGRN